MTQFCFFLWLSENRRDFDRTNGRKGRRSHFGLQPRREIRSARHDRARRHLRRTLEGRRVPSRADAKSFGRTYGASNQDVQDVVKNIPDITVDDSFYYLEEEDLIEMEINEVDKNQFGYFIVKYDFTNANVEVINTKGYNGNYTLTQINMDVDGE